MLVHARSIGNGFQPSQAETLETVSNDIWKGIPQTDEMGRRERDPSAIAAGERLKATRIALGHPNRRRFAQLMDVPDSNLAKWEYGAAMVPPGVVSKLKKVYGVSHDWIYDGERKSLPYELALKLMDHPGD
jgi:DNA-binding transcriptional regulator YiaG